MILTVLEKGVALKDTKGASFLREVATGLLLNFLVFYKGIDTKQVIDKVSDSLLGSNMYSDNSVLLSILLLQSLLHRIVSVITDILETDASSDEAVMHALHIIDIINDFIVLNERLQKTLLFDILARSNASFERWEICLEIIHARVIKDGKSILN